MFFQHPIDGAIFECNVCNCDTDDCNKWMHTRENSNKLQLFHALSHYSYFLLLKYLSSSLQHQTWARSWLPGDEMSSKNFKNSCFKSRWPWNSDFVYCSVKESSYIYKDSWNSLDCFQFKYALPLQAGIEFKENLRVRFRKYGGLKIWYFGIIKIKKPKSSIHG